MIWLYQMVFIKIRRSLYYCLFFSSVAAPDKTFTTQEVGECLGNYACLAKDQITVSDFEKLCESALQSAGTLDNSQKRTQSLNNNINAFRIKHNLNVQVKTNNNVNISQNNAIQQASYKTYAQNNIINQQLTINNTSQKDDNQSKKTKDDNQSKNIKQDISMVILFIGIGSFITCGLFVGFMAQSQHMMIKM